MRHVVFPQLFRVLPSFHECSYTFVETRRTCFVFLLEKKRKQNLSFFSINANVNYLCTGHHYTASTAPGSFVFLSSSKSTAVVTRFLTACFSKYVSQVLQPRRHVLH